MNITYISANRFGWELLHEVMAIQGANVQRVITLSSTSPIKMYDYVQHPCFPALKLADNEGEWDVFKVPIIKVNRITEAIQTIQKDKPDLIIAAGWREMIPKEILDCCHVIGFHPSLLPYGRGSAPIIKSILNHATFSGVTMFYLSNEVDNGSIIGQSRFKIARDDYALDVYLKATEAGRVLIRRYLPLVLNGTEPKAFPDFQPITPSLDKNSNQIRLNSTIDDINTKIRAFSYPYDGAYIRTNKGMIRIFKGLATK